MASEDLFEEKKPAETVAVTDSAIPGLPDAPDDIPDPTTPPGVVEEVAPSVSAWSEHEALLSGFCQALQGRIYAWLHSEHASFMKGMDSSWSLVHASLEGLGKTTVDAQQRLDEALACVRRDGIEVRGAPYSASVRALSATGFDVTLRIEKREVGELVDELERMTGWLQAHGYTNIASFV